MEDLSRIIYRKFRPLYVLTPKPIKAEIRAHAGEQFSSEKSISLHESILFSSRKESISSSLKYNKESSAFSPWSVQEPEKGFTEQCSITKSDENSPNEFSHAFSDEKCQPDFKETCKEKNDLEEEDIKELDGVYSYKGNNWIHSAGVNAHRKDVVFKTLVRSIRRYLWFVFTKTYDTKLLGKYKKSKIFKEYVTEFYLKNIKNKSNTALDLNKDEENSVLFYIGTMMSKDYCFPDENSRKMGERTRANKIFNEMTKSFSVCKFQKFFSIKSCKNAIKILKESGIVSKIIDLYKPLSALKERYEQAVEVLIDSTEENLRIFDN